MEPKACGPPRWLLAWVPTPSRWPTSSSSDAEVAAALGKDYVAVKVDREERPDVDQIYMAVTQALTGSGGWPNSSSSDASTTAR